MGLWFSPVSNILIIIKTLTTSSNPRIKNKFISPISFQFCLSTFCFASWLSLFPVKTHICHYSVESAPLALLCLLSGVSAFYLTETFRHRYLNLVRSLLISSRFSYLFPVVDHTTGPPKAILLTGITTADWAATLFASWIQP